MPQPIAQRLWARVDRSNPNACWLWPGAKNSYGYPLIVEAGKQCQAHRVAYELAIGEIPEGLVIDHLCRTPLCINPAHLEVVTIAENVRRSLPFRAPKLRCKHGHLLEGDNVRIVHSSGRRPSRVCVTCRRISAREWARRNYQPRKGAS